MNKRLAPAVAAAAPAGGLTRRSMLALAGLLGGTAALAACGGPSTAGTGGAVETAGTDWASINAAGKITWWSNMELYCSLILGIGNSCTG